MVLHPLQASLLDKIVAVVNDEVITLSMIKRMQSNLAARNNISPQIYGKLEIDQREAANLMIQKAVIRAKLAEIGYTISDDQVEAQIKGTEQRLGLTRDSLLQFLKSNNLSFDEYFEITKEAIEFNIFTSRIIRTLIAISKQEVKNAFYKENSANQTIAFKYNLVDFYLDKDEFSGTMLSDFQPMLKKFKSNGILPAKYKNLTTNAIDSITEEGLTSELKGELKKTIEGSFSKPILLNNQYHIFYVKKKELTESELFLEQKGKVRAKLLEDKAHQMTSVWIKRERNKHYIKYFF